MRLLLPLWLLFMASCSSVPSFDPNARETPARITSKKMVSAVVRETAETNSGVLAGLGIVTRDRLTATPVYEYLVQEKEGTLTKVLSEARGFEVGQCVNLLYSIQATYPRIAYGADCSSF